MRFLTRENLLYWLSKRTLERETVLAPKYTVISMKMFHKQYLDNDRNIIIYLKRFI